MYILQIRSESKLTLWAFRMHPTEFHLTRSVNTPPAPYHRLSALSPALPANTSAEPGAQTSQFKCGLNPRPNLI